MEMQERSDAGDGFDDERDERTQNVGEQDADKSAGKTDERCFGKEDVTYVAFSRAESVPMTKSEIRAVCLSKLALREDSVVWDVGAGTGSVTVEAAMAARRGRVYAVERKDAAFDILRENLRRFHTDNVTPVSGTAPDACADLPAPTHAFLGGTTGHMKEIIALLLEKNPRVRIVATAVTLESVAELTECVKAFPFRETEAVSLTAARSRKAGAYHLMTGQNPVYIFTMQG